MVRVAQAKKLHLLLGIDSDKSEIVRAIGIEGLGVILRLIGERDLNAATARDHVIIRQNEAVLVN